VIALFHPASSAIGIALVSGFSHIFNSAESGVDRMIQSVNWC